MEVDEASDCLFPKTMMKTSTWMNTVAAAVVVVVVVVVAVAVVVVVVVAAAVAVAAADIVVAVAVVAVDIVASVVVKSRVETCQGDHPHRSTSYHPERCAEAARKGYTTWRCHCCHLLMTASPAWRGR